MKKKRVYVVFDREDQAVQQSLLAQSRSYDCPFTTVEHELDGPLDPRYRMSECVCVLVLCSEATARCQHTAAALQLAAELGKPYFLLRAAYKSSPTRPLNARPSDKIWAFRWPHVSALIDHRPLPPDAAVDATAEAVERAAAHAHASGRR
jgi:hypothetical protein